MRSAVEAIKIVYQEQEISVTVSIGVGAIRPEENLDDLFQRADQSSIKHQTTRA
jgi:PleD family two-component response regulator